MAELEDKIVLALAAAPLTSANLLIALSGTDASAIHAHAMNASIHFLVQSKMIEKWPCLEGSCSSCGCNRIYKWRLLPLGREYLARLTSVPTNESEG